MRENFETFYFEKSYSKKLVPNFEFLWKVRENESLRKLVRIRYFEYHAVNDPNDTLPSLIVEWGSITDFFDLQGQNFKL